MATPGVLLNAGSSFPGRLDVTCSYSVYNFQSLTHADAMNGSADIQPNVDSGTVMQNAINTM